MILDVANDVKVFSFIMIITLLAFADPIYVLANSNRDFQGEDGPVFVGYGRSILYIYKAAMGDWDTDGFDGHDSESLLYALWLGCTFLNLIVMLNLLIAIISETFARVNETSLEHSYKEKSAVIADLQAVHTSLQNIKGRFI